ARTAKVRSRLCRRAQVRASCFIARPPLPARACVYRITGVQRQRKRPPLVEAPRAVSGRGRVPDRTDRAPLARLRRDAPRPLEPPRAAANRRAHRRGPVPRALLAGGVRLLRPARADLLRAQARGTVALARGAWHGAPLGDLRRHGARVRA